MNIHETNGRSVTDVLPRAFDPEATRRFLIAERVLAGSKSPMGHRCSNLIEQIKSYQTAADPAQRAYLEASIRRSVAEIQALKDRRVIAAPVPQLSAFQ